MDNTLKSIIDNQKDYFNSKKTIDINFRIALLKNLKKEIELNEKDIENALNIDLGKSSGESYLTEIAFVYFEIKIALKNIKKWVKRKPVRSSLLNFPSSDYIIAEPYGNTLHISPWNYPFQLAIAPLIGAVAAGNTVLLKCVPLSMMAGRSCISITTHTAHYTHCTLLTAHYTAHRDY